MNFSPLTFFGPEIRGSNLSHLHHRGLKNLSPTGVIIMKKMFFPKRVFLNVRSKNGVFGGHSILAGRAPTECPPPTNFFLILTPDGVHGLNGDSESRYVWEELIDSTPSLVFSWLARKCSIGLIGRAILTKFSIDHISSSQRARKAKPWGHVELMGGYCTSVPLRGSASLFGR